MGVEHVWLCGIEFHRRQPFSLLQPECLRRQQRGPECQRRRGDRHRQDGLPAQQHAGHVRQRVAATRAASTASWSTWPAAETTPRSPPMTSCSRSATTTRRAPGPRSRPRRPSRFAPARACSGSDRVTITWASGSIRNNWLEVQVLPTANTGLTATDVFFWGNKIGDTGQGTPATTFLTSGADKTSVLGLLGGGVADHQHSRLQPRQQRHGRRRHRGDWLAGQHRPTQCCCQRDRSLRKGTAETRA